MAEFFGERQAAAVLKHAILEKYFSAYVSKTGRTSWQRRVAYVDGFAGPGLYDDGSSGSPAVAVDTARALAGFGQSRTIDGYLVESNLESCAALRAFITAEGFPWTVYEGEVEEHLPSILAALPKSQAAFFFLDPFGLGVPFQMLADVMARSGTLKFGYRTGGAATELLLNFSLPGLRRNAGHLTSTKKVGSYEQARETILSRVDANLGGDWWREIWTKTSPGRREKAILDRYTDMLRKLAGGYVWSIPCADRWQGPPSYYLIFVTQHPDGAWLFHQAVSSATEVYRKFCFADANPGLFDEEKLRNDEWIKLITANIRDLLASGAFVVEQEMERVYGSTLTFARDKHVRAAIKALYKEGVTSTNGVGDIQKMRVVPA